jgi:hypothetical protein
MRQEAFHRMAEPTWTPAACIAEPRLIAIQAPSANGEELIPLNLRGLAAVVGKEV